jgi:MFS family permease
MKQLLRNSHDPTTPRIWTFRDMRLVLPARALSFLGDSLAFVLISLQLAKSDDPAVMAAYFIAFSLPLFVMSPVAGRVIDEFDSRLVLAVAGVVQVVASLGLVWGPSIPAILGFVVLLQVGQAFTGPSWAALVPRIVGDELVGKAIGLQQSLAGLAGLAGAALGGVLYDVLGYHETMLLDTVTFGGLVLTALMVQTRRGRRFDVTSGNAAAHDSTRDTSISAGLRFIRHNSLLRLLIPALMLFIVSAEAANVVEVFLITDDLGATAATYGLAMAALMVGQIIGPLLAGRVSTDERRISSTAAAAGGIGAALVAVGLAPNAWVTLPLFVICGVCGGALNTHIPTLTVKRTPELIRGRVLSLMMGGSRGFSVLAMVLGGVAGQFLGARGTFVVCGGLSLAVALVVLRSRRGLETRIDLPAERHPVPV